MAYSIGHNNFWHRRESNFGRWYVYRVNPNAAAHDSPGDPVAWMPQSPFLGGSDSHIRFDAEQERMARRVADHLNASAMADAA